MNAVATVGEWHRSCLSVPRPSAQAWRLCHRALGKEMVRPELFRNHREKHVASCFPGSFCVSKGNGRRKKGSQRMHCMDGPPPVLIRVRPCFLLVGWRTRVHNNAAWCVGFDLLDSPIHHAPLQGTPGGSDCCYLCTPHTLWKCLVGYVRCHVM